jgi:3-phosphoshikimate 1-carboxyvinyltransferase
VSAPLWLAPTAVAPVDAAVAVPGSKSMTNRALVLAALAAGPSVVRRPLRARDTWLMAAGLAGLGVGIEDCGDLGADWQLTPAALRGPADVDCGLAGTVMRFLPPVAALADGDVRFDGDPRARERPMRPLLTALRHLGADITDDGRGGLPFTVRGRGGLPGGAVSVDASASSQFVSALLLAAPCYTRGLTVQHVGPPVPSLPHIMMTLSMLADAGGVIEHRERTMWRVEPGELRGTDLTVEPDLSNAAPFLAAALVTGGRVRVPDWPSTSPQPGHELPALLGRMGATCTVDEQGLTLSGGGRVTGVDADLRDLGELTPVLAAVAVLADSPSSLRGIGHLRGHETDRLTALAKEINGLGGDVTDTDDGLEIRPRRLHGGTFATYDDHRLATAAAVIGLVVPGVHVENVVTTAKTLPDFVDMWTTMLGAER